MRFKLSNAAFGGVLSIPNRVAVCELINSFSSKLGESFINQPFSVIEKLGTALVRIEVGPLKS